MPWPTFMVQNFAFAYAIILDDRPKPLFPKELVVVNVLMPIIFSFTSGVHTVKSGPLAWNGAFAFYVIGVMFVLQLVLDGVYLWLAAREEERENGCANPSYAFGPQIVGTENDVEGRAASSLVDSQEGK